MPYKEDSGVKESKLAETGVTVSETAFRGAQDALAALTGTHARPVSGAPVLGPANLDQALSDLANRTARIFYFTPPSAEALPGAVEHWLKAVRTSFQYLDSSDSSSLALPLLLPLENTRLALHRIREVLFFKSFPPRSNTTK